MSVKLKPCPFCGSDACEDPMEGHSGGWWVECGTCHAPGPVVGSGPPGTTDFSVEAETAWNTRHDPFALDFSLEATDAIDEVAEREHDRSLRMWKVLKLLVRYINAGHLPEYATSHYYAAKALLREVEAPDDGASE